jgi:CRP/FNR family transcriptional regulator, cyclic AMP receptor protein
MMQSGAEALVQRSKKAPMTPPPDVRMRRTRRETVAALASVSLFADFTKRHLSRLARETDELAFAPRETIVEEGMLGETLFVVLSGRAIVVRKGRTLGEVLPGDFFGELSALDGGPRTASVVADTPVRVLRLFRHTLYDLLSEQPQLAVRLLTGIARRIRDVERQKR